MEVAKRPLRQPRPRPPLLPPLREYNGSCKAERAAFQSATGGDHGLRGQRPHRRAKRNPDGLGGIKRFQARGERGVWKSRPETVAETVPAIERPDVVAAYHKPALKLSGFELQVPIASLNCSAASGGLTVFGSLNGRAAYSRSSKTPSITSAKRAEAFARLVGYRAVI